MLSNENILGLGIRLVWHCLSDLRSCKTGADHYHGIVMYIPAVPLTPQNQEYIERQKTSFLSGERPPDFPKGKNELTFVGVATANDVVGKAGRRAMGLQEAY